MADEKKKEYKGRTFASHYNPSFKEFVAGHFPIYGKDSNDMVEAYKACTGKDATADDKKFLKGYKPEADGNSGGAESEGE